MKQPKVAVVILNWNGYEDTVGCIHSIKAGSYKNLRIIVVDNGSDNDEGKRLQKAFRGIEVVQNDKNYGTAEGNNRGIRLALVDKEVIYILMLNNDIEMEPQAISELVAHAEKNEQIGMVASRMMNYYERDKVDNLGILLTTSGLGYNRKTEKYPLFCPCSGCGLYRADALQKAMLGNEVWDSDFFIYVDELDVGFRLRLMGYTADYASQAVIYHKEGAATGGPVSDFSIFHGHRNNLWFLVKNYPWQFWLRYFPGIFMTQVGTFFLYFKWMRPWIIVKAKSAALRGIPNMLRKRRFIQNKNLPLAHIKQAMVPRIVLNPEET